jgi:hypothetical protein
MMHLAMAPLQLPAKFRRGSSLPSYRPGVWLRLDGIKTLKPSERPIMHTANTMVSGQVPTVLVVMKSDQFTRENSKPMSKMRKSNIHDNVFLKVMSGAALMKD